MIEAQTWLAWADSVRTSRVRSHRAEILARWTLVVIAGCLVAFSAVTASGSLAVAAAVWGAVAAWLGGRIAARLAGARRVRAVAHHARQSLGPLARGMSDDDIARLVVAGRCAVQGEVAVATITPDWVSVSRQPVPADWAVGGAQDPAVPFFGGT